MAAPLAEHERGHLLAQRLPAALDGWDMVVLLERPVGQLGHRPPYVTATPAAMVGDQ